MSIEADLVIIGAGPAGLAAGMQAIELGLNPIILDADLQPGGQYFRQNPDGVLTVSEGQFSFDAIKVQMGQSYPAISSETTVWHIVPQADDIGFNLYLHHSRHGGSVVHSKKVILATGAFERVLPFPGWTLPGVMATGVSHLLIEHPQDLMHKRVMVYGTGPLLWPTAAKLAKNGAYVCGVVDVNPFPWGTGRMIPRVWKQSQRVKEAVVYLMTFLKQRIPFHWKTRIDRAEGKLSLERVNLQNSAGKQKSINLDYLFVGHGLAASHQLALVAGAKFDFLPDEGVFSVVRDSTLQTTVPGLFSVGDGVYTMGKDAAAMEGRLAALSAAVQLGMNVEPSCSNQLHRALKAEQKFVHLLNQIFPFQNSWFDDLSDETVLCRCEDVTVGQVRDLLAQGVSDLDNIKTLTRIGMGRCQGRFCSANLAGLVARYTHQPLEKVRVLLPKPPVLPVPLHTLLNHGKQDES